MLVSTFDYRRLRGILATQRITHKRFASACGLNYPYVARILNGRQPGELALIKMKRGLTALGITLPPDEQEVPRAS